MGQWDKMKDLRTYLLALCTLFCSPASAGEPLEAEQLLTMP